MNPHIRFSLAFLLAFHCCLLAQEQPVFPLAAAAVIQNVPAVVKPPPQPVFNPRTYGAKGDGATYDTAALQKAIDACAGTRGSVVLSDGVFLSAQITLKPGMTFYLAKGATLRGGLEPGDYPDLVPANDSATPNRRSLLYACGADGLVIDGEGVIDGRGKDVKIEGKEPTRPSLLRIFQSKDVTVRNITLRNPKMWTQVYTECDRLLIDHVKVEAASGDYNLDGLDIFDSADVQIRNCRIDSEDDSICLKSRRARGLQRIVVENNQMLCRRANAIKFGTATRGPINDVRIINNVVTFARYAGLCIESVDGSALSNVVVSGLEMKEVGQPIFVRLARRAESPQGVAAASLTGVTIQKVRALRTHGVTGSVNTITGVPGLRVSNVKLKDIYLEMPGGVNKVPGAPLELEKEYPQSNLLGPTPAWAFYVRHADGIVLENVTVKAAKADARKWFVADDANVKTLNCHDEQPKPAAPALKSVER